MNAALPCTAAPDVWATPDGVTDIAVARRGCALCPDQVGCLARTKALPVLPDTGVWGGRTAQQLRRERRAEAAARRRAKVPV